MIPKQWNDVFGREVLAGNKVLPLIGGAAAFAAMYDAISTVSSPNHYIYLLGWTLDLDLPLVESASGTDCRHLFATASDRCGAQIRVMLWIPPIDLAWYSSQLDALSRWLSFSGYAQTQVRNAVDRINSEFLPKLAVASFVNNLRTGATILDDRTLGPYGCHHQKMLVVKGSRGLIAFCGGIDINPDRVRAIEENKGSPLHDAHCQVEGGAANILVDVFVERWMSHPEHSKLDKTPKEGGKGPLLGLSDRQPAQISKGNTDVRVVRTSNSAAQVKIENDKALLPSYLSRGVGCIRQQSIRESLGAAIRAARRYIYIEDQYLWSREAASLLHDALEHIEYLIFLVPAVEISDGKKVLEALRRQFLLTVMTSLHFDKVRIYYRVKPNTTKIGPKSYIHAKVWIIDDEVAYIGSGNCNERGWQHDSEVGVVLYDGRPSLATGPYPLPQKLRMDLWQQHLGYDADRLRDCRGGVKLWEDAVNSAGRDVAVVRYSLSETTTEALERLVLHKSGVVDGILDPTTEYLSLCPR
jgi:phosphatidylserine/phosphatidylglycerophosphate/cardiolipin synthase-like enzyme